jgi:site-specific recombinase XerD
VSEITPSASTKTGQRVRKYIEAAKATSTQRSYQSHWKDFQSFCGERGYKSLPASSAAVADYMTFLADIGAKMSTIQVKAAAISYIHRTANVDNPVRTVAVQETLRGIRRTLGTAQNGKDPIALHELRELMDVLPDDIRGIRDKALLLIGFAGAFRRSELVELSVSDIAFEKNQIRITIRRSKTDQEGSGMLKVIPMLRDKTVCPVTALKNWLTSAAITDGPVFRPIDRWGNIHKRTMQPQEVARVIKKYAPSAKLDTQHYAGHSLRAGYVTEAADHDIPLWKIKQQTGHKSDTTVQRYIRNRGRGALDATRAAFGEEEE